MKIIALKPFAGTEVSLAEGAEAEVSDAFGEDMVKAGYAKKAGADEKPKTTAKKTTTKKS